MNECPEARQARRLALEIGAFLDLHRPAPGRGSGVSPRVMVEAMTHVPAVRLALQEQGIMLDSPAKRWTMRQRLAFWRLGRHPATCNPRIVLAIAKLFMHSPHGQLVLTPEANRVITLLNVAILGRGARAKTPSANLRQGEANGS